MPVKGLCESGGVAEYGNDDREVDDAPNGSLCESVGGDDQSKPSLSANDIVGSGKRDGSGVDSGSEVCCGANAATCSSASESPGSWIFVRDIERVNVEVKSFRDVELGPETPLPFIDGESNGDRIVTASKEGR
jgi:hypothetical protein